MRSHKEYKPSSMKFKSDCTDLQFIFFNKSTSVFLTLHTKIFQFQSETTNQNFFDKFEQALQSIVMFSAEIHQNRSQF